MSHGSHKAVVTAILSNSIVTVIKFLAALASGSAAMTNEAVHSLMDSLKQIPGERRETEQSICYANSRATVQATLTRTEQIIDELEAAVREKASQISHITIEVEGIVITGVPSA